MLISLLRAACACAGDALHTLKLGFKLDSGMRDDVLELVTAHAESLRELHVAYTSYPVPDTHQAALLRAAPSLRELHTHVLNYVGQVTAMLNGKPPWAPLRLRSVSVDVRDRSRVELEALFSAVATHEPLRILYLYGISAALHEPATLRGLVDAVIQRRLESLYFQDCVPGPAGAPELARLLRDGTLTTLHLCGDEPLVEDAAARVLAPALANSRLKELRLEYTGLWDALNAGVVLVRALAGHPTLRHFAMISTTPPAAAAPVAGAALAALVAADGALEELLLQSSSLGDAGLRPLVEALPENTHLQWLNVYGNGMSEAFQRNVLLPAVRANASLSRVDGLHEGTPSADEICAILAGRPRAYDTDEELWDDEDF